MTSQAYHKRWNRKNELLADAAEKASVAAEWLGGRPYPQQRLNDAWTLVMGGHFHDTGAGTATPRAYEFAWNDDIIAMNQFAGVLTSATEAIASGLNTQTAGHSGGGLQFAEHRARRCGGSQGNAAGRHEGGACHGSRWQGSPGAVGGRQGPLRGQSSLGGIRSVQRGTGQAPATSSTLKVNFPQGGRGFGGGGGGRGGRGGGFERSLENDRYHVTLDNAGDILSIYDKLVDKELLAGAHPPGDLERPSFAVAGLEYGFRPGAGSAARVRAQAAASSASRKTDRRASPSKSRTKPKARNSCRPSAFPRATPAIAWRFGNVHRLGDAVCQSEGHLPTQRLESTTPLTTGTWGRCSGRTPAERQFEVASHHWIDLTDKSGAFGATILTDCQERLRQAQRQHHPPDAGALARHARQRRYTDQANQDWGHHEFVFGIAGHAGDWRDGQTDWQAYRLNDPLIAFETGKHAGALGKEFSLMKIDNPRIQVMALKKAEQSDEVILRMVEVDGKPAAGRACELRRSDRRGARSEWAGDAGRLRHGEPRSAGHLVHALPAAHLCAAPGRRAGQDAGGAIAARQPDLRPGGRQQ